MNAAAGDFFVDGAPNVPSPIYWYANADGIFLYLNDISWMNAAITLYEVHVEAVKAGRQLPGEQPAARRRRKVARPWGRLVPDVMRSPANPPDAPGRCHPTDRRWKDSAALTRHSASGENAQPQAVSKAAARYLGTITAGPARGAISGRRRTAPFLRRSRDHARRHAAAAALRIV